MKKLLHTQAGFFIVYALFLIASIITLLTFNKIEIHAYMNTWNQVSLDNAMIFTTHLAEGVSIAILLVLALIYKVQSGVFIALSTASSGLITQFLKRQVFATWDRPSKVFQNFPEYQLYFVEGFDLHERFSFPSGHTTAAFALMFSLSIVINKPKLAPFFAAVAIAIGYSRIYLSQHFLQDVLVGSLIGTLCTLVLARVFHNKSFKAKWLNIGLHKKR